MDSKREPITTSILATASGGANRTRERGAGTRAWRPIGGGQRGESVANENGDEREASGQFGALKVFGRLKVNKSRFAGRLEDRRGSAQALGLSHRNWPSLICTQRCSPLCGGFGGRCCKVIFTSQASGAERQPRFLRL